MGDLGVCTSRLYGGGLAAEDHTFMSSVSQSSSSSLPPSPPPLPLSNPGPSTITAERWARAEQVTQEIVYRVQPTLMADQKRKDVIDYVQRLIRGVLGCEVFPYGSVPLKTYLPDGDIDLTALSSPNVDAALASDVCVALEAEVHNESAEFEVKDVQFIDAEVKLVKCLVQDIVVDISFNQLGGLCTLCFLEQVDRLIGKDHLFKRSIILIKAWCYYESRILGAHHGLISTYALEILVLYLFHLFHSSLNGPLAVLYRFLDYFGSFDWDNYCISLNGPVCKASLPDIVAELPENGGDDLLLSEDFLKYCIHMFCVPSRGLDTESQAFPLKHLNIIDPLKESNNLGRSVYRGNFFRIRSAFKFGARKLGWILMLPEESMAYELKFFFTNTLERNGSEYIRLLVGFSADRVLGTEDKNLVKIKNKTESYSMNKVSMQMGSENSCPAANGNVDSRYRLSGDAEELATYNFVDNGRIESVNLHQTMPSSSITMVEAGAFKNLGSTENHLVACNSIYSLKNHEGLTFSCSAVSIPVVSDVSEFSFHAFKEGDIAEIAGNAEELTSLLNLCGDYDSDFRRLLYSQYFHGYAISAPVSPSQLRKKNPWENVCHSRMNFNGASPLSPSRLRNKNAGDNVFHSLQSKQNYRSQMNTNGSVSRSHYQENHTAQPSAAFNTEEKKKARGTGTYFPNMNYRPHRVRQSLGRERNQAAGTHGQVQKHTHNKGFATALPESNLFKEVSYEPLQAQHSVLGQGNSGSSDCRQSHLSMKGFSRTNGFSLSSEKHDFVNLGTTTNGDLENTWGSSPSHVASLLSSLQVPKPVAGNDSERTEEQSYHLKDQDDFPPLSLNIYGRAIHT